MHQQRWIRCSLSFAPAAHTILSTNTNSKNEISSQKKLTFLQAHADEQGFDFVHLRHAKQILARFLQFCIVFITIQVIHYASALHTFMQRYKQLVSHDITNFELPSVNSERRLYPTFRDSTGVRRWTDDRIAINGIGLQCVR